LQVTWINTAAAPVGGCERYIQDSVELLSHRGIRSTLLYDPNSPFDPAYASVFDAALPLASVAEQLASLGPDLVYVHRYHDRDGLVTLAGGPVPVVRFFHDHQLFCLREHKYTGIGHQTCERRTGLHCYTCPGFVQRTADRGFRVASLRSLHVDQALNRALTAWVVGSQYMAGHVAAHGFPRDRIHVLPLFTHTPDAAPSPREANLAVFAGQLIRGKGVDVLLEAVSRMRQRIRLVIAGDGAQASAFRDLARRVGVDSQVEFAGRVDGDALAALYRRAACVVLPSRSPETFGLAGLEALAHGTPVVAADVGGIREWLVPEVTGLLFPSGDAAALAAQLDTMIAEPVRAARMGAAGRERAAGRFHPEAHGDALVELFGSLVSHS